MMVLSGFLRAASDAPLAVQTLSLAHTKVGSTGLAALALAPGLTRLDVSGIKVQHLRALGDALLARSTGQLGSLRCNSFDVPVGATACEIVLGMGVRRGRWNRGPPSGEGEAVLLAGVLKFNSVLSTISLNGCSLPV